jgi:hypothetical protein
VRAENLKALLQLPYSLVAGSVAVNLWRTDTTPRISTELFEDWKQIIISHASNEYDQHIMESIFRESPEIAYEWISRRLKEMRSGEHLFYFSLANNRAAATAVSVVTRDQRLKLINLLPPNRRVTELVQNLVRGDIEVFRHLLSKEELKDDRLAPLQIAYDSSGQTDNRTKNFGTIWEKMAIAALEKGFSEEDIFFATQIGGGSWRGPKSADYASRLVPFEKLAQHSEARLQIIGKIGLAHFSKLKNESLKIEKRAAIRGELC